MLITSVHISSIPEQIVILKDNSTILRPWRQVVELVPEIFSIENILSLYYEFETERFDISRRPGILPPLDGSCPELDWIKNNIDYLIERLGPLGLIYNDEAPTVGEKRSWLLSEVDWYVIRHIEQRELNVTPSLTEEQYEELLIYKQALRDLGQNPETLLLPFEAFNNYPTKPSWIPNT